MNRQSWIDKGDTVLIVRQCVLAGVSRATIYAQRKPMLAEYFTFYNSKSPHQKYQQRLNRGSADQLRLK